MNLTKNLEKTILSMQFVLFKIEVLRHPYNKLHVDTPKGVVIDDVLGVIRVPTMVIDTIAKAPLGGPVLCNFSETEERERDVELLFFGAHDVEPTTSFLETLSEKIEYAQSKPLTVWAFIPETVISATAAYFFGKKAENILLYRSYDHAMKPYILTYEKSITQTTGLAAGFYCRSFRS